MGLFASSLVAACGNDAGGPVAPGPSAGGSTATGGSSVQPTGGTATGGTANGGANTGGTAAGGSSGAGGASACPPNSVKHADDGMCHCQPASLMMCADGCGDFMTDPDHCGGCMTKCTATQACNAGKCTVAPTPVVPAPATCGGMHLAVNAGKLYYTDSMAGTVSSVAITGGAPTPLVSAQMKPTTIMVNGTALFWLAFGAKAVMTSPLTGGAGAAVTPTSTDDINGFTIDGTTLYWAAGFKVSKMPIAGGAPVEVGHEDSGVPHGLAVAGMYIGYPAAVNGDIDVMKMVEGTPAVCASEDSVTAVNKNCGRLARSQGDLVLDSIFIIGDDAYWANMAQITTSSASAPTGFNTTVTNSPSDKKITAFTVAGGKVYFADESGGVFQSPLTANSTATSIARGQKNPTSVAADDANVYWANEDCSIMSAPLK